MLSLKVMLIAFLLLPLWGLAAEPEITVDQRPVDKNSMGQSPTGQSPTGQSPTDQKKIAEKKTELKDEVELSKSTGKTLKEKKLSTAFEQFIPSEKISADNAVPFPVDI